MIQLAATTFTFEGRQEFDGKIISVQHSGHYFTIKFRVNVQGDGPC
jgi:hypothetical protein